MSEVRTATSGLTAKEIIQRQASQGKAKKLLDFAVKYGVVKLGWTSTDYMRDAVKNYGWESTGITGLKGTAKSNLLMQRGFSVYEDWKDVLDHMVTERDQFMDLLESAIENKVRIPWIGVDDIATIFPRSLYFTDRKLYSELKSSWETTRTTISNFDWTATRKNKVATFITDDITGDIITYNRVGETKGHYDYRRWLWYRNYKDPNEMVAKLIAIEDIPFPLLPDSVKIDAELKCGEFIVCGKSFKGKALFERARLLGVPRPTFVEYWNNRLALASGAYHRFKKIIEASKRKEKSKNALTIEETGRYGYLMRRRNQGKLTGDEQRDLMELSLKKLGK